MTQKNKKEKKSSSKKKVNLKKVGVRVVAVGVAVYFIYVMIWQQVMISRKNAELDELTVLMEQATEESERLQREIENLSDPEYIESYAREHLGLVLPNERVFVDANKSDDNTAE